MAESANSGGETRYKIGDVCRIADVQPYVLRYWESEFPVLAADKSVPGPRTYSPRELKLIEQIKRLLYDEGYTIAGAKKRLEGDAGGKADTKDAKADASPAGAPPAAEPAAKPARVEKPDRAVETPEEAVETPEKPEKAPRPPRPVKAASPALPDASPEIARPAAQARAEDSVARAVAELKEVLALLTRPLP